MNGAILLAIVIAWVFISLGWAMRMANIENEKKRNTQRNYFIVLTVVVMTSLFYYLYATYQ